MASHPLLQIDVTKNPICQPKLQYMKEIIPYILLLAIRSLTQSIATNGPHIHPLPHFQIASQLFVEASRGLPACSTRLNLMQSVSGNKPAFQRLIRDQMSSLPSPSRSKNVSSLCAMVDSLGSKSTLKQFHFARTSLH